MVSRRMRACIPSAEQRIELCVSNRCRCSRQSVRCRQSGQDDRVPHGSASLADCCAGYPHASNRLPSGFGTLAGAAKPPQVSGGRAAWPLRPSDTFLAPRRRQTDAWTGLEFGCQRSLTGSQPLRATIPSVSLDNSGNPASSGSAERTAPYSPHCREDRTPLQARTKRTQRERFVPARAGSTARERRPGKERTVPGEGAFRDGPIPFPAGHHPPSRALRVRGRRMWCSLKGGLRAAVVLDPFFSSCVKSLSGTDSVPPELLPPAPG